MKTKRILLSLTLLLTAVANSDAGAQAGAGQEPEGAEEIKAAIAAIRAERIAALEEARRNRDVYRPVRICQVFMTVDYVEEGQDPHLNMGDVLLLVGPIPFSGNYQVTPVSGLGGGAWNHPWKNKHYSASPALLQPNDFELSSVWVGPHNNDEEREHAYRMKITDWEDDCPSYVMFESAGHVGGPILLDPGHAGATK